MWGTKRRTSMRKESKVRIRVKMLSMNTPKRYRGECDGECRCAVPAKTVIINVNSPAIGWRMRIEERVVLVPTGKSKVAVCLAEKRPAERHELALVLGELDMKLWRRNEDSLEHKA
jgi:hypothetical protein